MLAVGAIIHRSATRCVFSSDWTGPMEYYKGAVAHGRVPSQKIAQLSLNKSLEDIFYTNT